MRHRERHSSLRISPRISSQGNSIGRTDSNAYVDLENVKLLYHCLDPKRVALPTSFDFDGAHGHVHIADKVRESE